VNRLTVNWCGGLIGKGRLGDGAPLISFTHSGFHSVRRRKLIEISRNSRKKKGFCDSKRPAELLQHNMLLKSDSPSMS